MSTTQQIAQDHANAMRANTDKWHADEIDLITWTQRAMNIEAAVARESRDVQDEFNRLMRANAGRSTQQIAEAHVAKIRQNASDFYERRLDYATFGERATALHAAYRDEPEDVQEAILALLGQR